MLHLFVGQGEALSIDPVTLGKDVGGNQCLPQ